MSGDEAATLVGLTRDVHVAMLTTCGHDGALMARPMAPQRVEDDGTMWFFARRDSAKVDQITADPVAGVVLADGSTWVSLSGRASVVTDDATAEELWNPSVEAWLPEGPDDAQVVLIRFAAEGGEYWSSTGPRVATALRLAVAKVTGRRPDVGTNATAEL